MCGKKKRHETREAAEAQLWRLVRAGAAKSRLKAYKCDHCTGYHVGHVGKRGGVS